MQNYYCQKFPETNKLEKSFYEILILLKNECTLCVLLLVLVKSVKSRVSIARWYLTGFWFQETAVQIPEGKNVHLLFFIHDLMIASYLREWLKSRQR